MLITKKWAMPNKNTFSIKIIKFWILDKLTEGVWLDPFARQSPFKTKMITNDLNPKFKTDYNIKAIDFLKKFEDETITGIVFDPPYTPRQLKESYNNIGLSLHDTKSSVWAKWKDEIARVLKPNGICLSFGFNSSGLGKKRNFTQKEILLISHGGNHNDTICTYEIKNYQKQKLNDN